MLFDFLKSFFKDYKYCEDFILPIPWLEKLRPEIEGNRINKKHIKKKIKGFLDINYDVSIGLDIISKKCIIINICTEEGEHLKEITSILKDDSNLYPFWVVFPDSPIGSIFFRQGISEYYLNLWLPHWVSLTEEQQHEYFKKYNASEDWQEWLLENSESLKKNYLNK